MDTFVKTQKNNYIWILNYLKEVFSWTIFSILMVIGALLLYYFVSIRLYAAKGEKYEPLFSVYTIVSGSMTPTINVYDVIINTKVKDINDVKINDVVTFISTWEVNSGMTVTHRVIGTKVLDNGETCLITRGDYNTGQDQSCVKKENLIGVTRAVIPKLGNIQAFLSSRIGWLLVVILPILYLLAKNVLKIIKLAANQNEKEMQSENSKNTLQVGNNKKDMVKAKNKYLEEAYKDLKKVKKQKLR